MPKAEKAIRLQKYIADCGVCSRRKAEELILANQVRVNDKRVNEMGVKVIPGEDMVMVNGQIIDILTVDHVYVVFNKPRSCVTTVNDPEGRKTVMDYVAHVKERVFPVGRLDYLSEGLLLFTNDGDLAHKIMHPSFELVKTYEVKVFGKITAGILEKLKKPIMDKGEKLHVQSVRVIKQLPNKTWLEFRLTEGKNREIRRVCEHHGLTIDKLKRVAIGGLSIDGVKPGEWEYITKGDLLRNLGIDKAGNLSRKAQGAYVSAKRSMRLGHKKNKLQKDAKAANDTSFEKYRKENYQKTMTLHKLIATEQKLAQKQAEKLPKK